MNDGVTPGPLFDNTALNFTLITARMITQTHSSGYTTTDSCLHPALTL